ncbi:MAG: multiprotein bridging factor aMBF1 [Nanoarchaeota archaeon]|nr:multiprotein bridging factor aMBF1 [Nanoarchaeota archaeon]
MASCEMCGYNGDLKSVIIEGSILKVCVKCMQYGQAVDVSSSSSNEIGSRLIFKSKKKGFQSEESEIIVSDYAGKVKRARERMGQKQEEVAQAIAEKVSVLHKIESGALEPTLKLAKKLEQYLKISLVKESEKVSDEVVKEFNTKGGSFTIGDLIKLK